MPIRLTAYLDSGAYRRKVFDDGEYVIGRSEQSAFGVPDRRISREHLRLIGDAAGWRVIDLSSKNGTRLNGRPISSAALEGDAWLSLGGVPVRVEELAGDAIAKEAAAENNRRRAGAAAARGPRQAATLSALLQSGLDGAIELSGCKRASIWAVGEGGLLTLALRSGGASPRESGTVLRDVAERGEAILTNDVEGVKALACRESILSGGIRAIACFPLTVDGVITGVLYTDSPQVGKTFSELDIELLQTLAEQTSIALAAVKLRDEIRAAGFAGATGPGGEGPPAALR